MILYFFNYIAFLLVIGTVGISILLVVKRKFKLTLFESLFISIFGGYVITITIFSIIQTGFKTVNIFYILLFSFALLEVLKLPTEPRYKITNAELKYGLQMFGSIVLFYGLSYYSFYNPYSFISFNYNHPDYILYAKIAKYISITGEENGFNHLNLLDSYYNGPEPYHFFDLWGSSLTYYLFGINHYLGLRLIIYPTFYLMFFVAVICLFQRLIWFKILLVFVLIWYGGFFLYIFQSVPLLENLSNISTNLFNPSLYKLSFFYVFILSAYLTYRKQHYGLTIICLLGLTIANIITAPTILSALFIVITISYLNKVISKYSLFTYLAYLITFSVLLVYFYSIFKGERAGLAGAEITSPLSLLQDSFSIQNLKTQRNIILGSSIYLLVLYFPIIFILLKRHSLITIKNLPLVFVITVVFISMSIWAVLFHELNSSQIFYTISTSTINVSAIILIISGFDIGVLSFNTKSISLWGINILILFTLGINVINSIGAINNLNKETHSSEYLKKVFESIPENELIATLKSPKEMEEMHSKYNAVYPLGGYLFLFDKNINSVNIGDHYTPIDSTSKMNIIRSLKAIRDGLFYRFSQLDENKDLTRNDLTIKFLKAFDIKFLIASKNVELPQIIEINTKSTITDSLSGERFIELKMPSQEVNNH